MSERRRKCGGRCALITCPAAAAAAAATEEIGGMHDAQTDGRTDGQGHWPATMPPPTRSQPTALEETKEGISAEEISVISNRHPLLAQSLQEGCQLARRRDHRDGYHSVRRLRSPGGACPGLDTGTCSHSASCRYTICCSCGIAKTATSILIQISVNVTLPCRPIAVHKSSRTFLAYKVPGNFPTSPSICPTSPLVTTNAPPMFCPFSVTVRYGRATSGLDTR